VRIVDLGTLGGEYSQAYAMNERGDVVGVSNATPGVEDLHPVLWRDGSIIDLGVVGRLGTGARAVNNRGQVAGCIVGGEAFLVQAFVWEDGRLTMQLGNYCATAINEKGQVVGGQITPDGRSRAFLWQEGTVTDIGASLGWDSIATGINDQGQVVGVMYTASQTESHTFTWQEGVVTDLGTLGGLSSSPSGINNRGQVAGTSHIDTSSTQHPFLWSQGAMTDLLASHGGTYAYAFDLNDFGEVVGQLDGRPFLWRDGTLIDLSIPGRSGAASVINNRGHVAGTHEDLYGNDDRVFLWRHGKTTDLGTLGGSYVSLVGIDMRDRVAGFGDTATGSTRAFLWIPTP
jgi:probable HAF family extracellular repeat protein